MGGSALERVRVYVHTGQEGSVSMRGDQEEIAVSELVQEAEGRLARVNRQPGAKA